MTIEIKAPTLPESVPDGTIATWYKKEGESVSRDELLVDIETDKVLLEVVAPDNGVLKSIKKGEGDTVLSNELLAIFEAGAVDTTSKPKSEDIKATKQEAPEDNSGVEVLMSPAAKKIIEENALSPNNISSTGKDGRITKEDVLKHLESQGSVSTISTGSEQPVQTKADNLDKPGGSRPEERVPMTRLRAKVAERLLQATSTTAMLTTFNEVNMQPVMDLRNKYVLFCTGKHRSTEAVSRS